MTKRIFVTGGAGFIGSAFVRLALDELPDCAVTTFDALVNFAAESHVDRSIADADVFLRTNILGTQVLLDAARARGVRRFVQVSTDEVMGSLPEVENAFFTESSPFEPN